MTDVRAPAQDRGYAWVVVAVSFYAITMSMAVRYAFGVLLVVFVREFGWSRGATSGAISLHLLCYGLAAPFVGVAIDRYDRRRLLGAAGLLLGLAVASLALVQSPWHLYLLYGLTGGIAASGLGLVPHLRIISEWFVRRRGLALGLTLAGTGSGSLLAPAVQTLIALGGWRRALLVFGGFIALTTCPAIWWGQRPPPAFPVPDAGALPGRRPDHWPRGLGWLCVAYGFHGFVAHMILAHEVAYLVDLRFDMLWATTLLGAVGLFGVVGNVAWGILTDRGGSGRACASAFAISLAGVVLLLALPQAQGKGMAAAQVALSGLGFGGLTAALGSLMSERFSGARLGEFYGISVLVFSLGSFGGPLTAGIVHDVTDSYTVAFLLAAAAVALGAACTWAGVHAPHRTA
jgi:MFS family permease